MKKVRLLSLALAFVLMLSLIGCAGSSEPTQPTTANTGAEVVVPAQSDTEKKEEKILTLTYWLEPFPEWIDQVYADTGIKIEYEQVESKNYYDIMSTRLQGGTASDIFWAYNKDAGILYGEAGYAIDLTDCAWLSNIKTVAIETAKEKGNGRVYGIPDSDNYYNQLWYNKDLFNELGLSVPQNIEELNAVCDKLLDAGITPFAHGAGESNHLKRIPFDPINIVLSQDGGYEWVCGLPSGDSKFTDEIFIKAATYFENSISKGYLSSLSSGITHVEAWELFASGQIAMMTGESFYADQNYAQVTPDFEVGVVPTPYNYEGEPAFHMGLSNVPAIMGNAKSDNQKVILEYLEYYYTHLDDYASITGMCKPASYGLGDWSSFAWMFDEWKNYPTTKREYVPALIQKDYEAWQQGVVVGEKAIDGLSGLQERYEAAK